MICARSRCRSGIVVDINLRSAESVQLILQRIRAAFPDSEG
jgi:hypothetical protein